MTISFGRDANGQRKKTKKELREHICALEEKITLLEDVQNHQGTLPDTGLATYDETLKGFIEGCPDGVGLLVDGRVVYANARLRDMSGYADDEMVGMLATDFV
ncbi:MAG: PAS domain-containing protein, partial [Chloroflexi bacterium]|nr:PAS domain-containing protein [Chloroflexota bacterium]